MTDDPAFDFIVVGGGSAGCVMAARLSEVPENRVLLVEAGPDNRSWKIDMPLAVDRLLTSDEFNWAFESEPEPGIGGRRMEQPRGRVLGGSSSINGMVYTRGNPQDYDAWRDNFGARGWGYADVLPYFRRMETAPRGADRYRGGEGPLKIRRPDTTAHPLNRAFMAAGAELGYPLTDDYNGARHEGFAAGEQSINGGTRSSAARAYLTPDVRNRPNLKIRTGCLAERIVFEGRRATGLQYRRDGTSTMARAHREVILAAGAFGTPQLLMLSGVGPATHLRQHGITPVLDLPGVGRNLQDHPDVTIQYRCTAPVSLNRYARWPHKLFVGLDWFLRRRGIAASNQFEAAAYLRTRAGIAKPNIKLEFLPLSFRPDDYKPYPFEAFQIHMTLMNAQARGEVMLRSADASDKPLISFNYLDNEADMRTLREAVAMARELVDASAFDAYRGEEIDPGVHVTDDTALDAWIRERMNTAYHPTCTCRIGSADDPASVVGPDLRVHGTEALRIADASVMPEVVTANTNATTIMIGERGADFALNKPQLAPDNAPYWIHPNWETEQR